MRTEILKFPKPNSLAVLSFGMFSGDIDSHGSNVVDVTSGDLNLSNAQSSHDLKM